MINNVTDDMPYNTVLQGRSFERTQIGLNGSQFVYYNIRAKY